MMNLSARHFSNEFYLPNKMAIIQILSQGRKLLLQTFNIAVRSYSTQGPIGLGKKLSKADLKWTAKAIELPVEKDTKKLAAFVCGTKLFQESGENVPIKPDSEYPDWLWTLHIGEPLPLSKLDPNTIEYWERVREIGFQQQRELSALYQQNRDYK